MYKHQTLIVSLNCACWYILLYLTVHVCWFSSCSCCRIWWILTIFCRIWILRSCPAAATTTCCLSLRITETSAAPRSSTNTDALTVTSSSCTDKTSVDRNQYLCTQRPYFYLSERQKAFRLPLKLFQTKWTREMQLNSVFLAHESESSRGVS